MGGNILDESVEGTGWENSWDDVTDLGSGSIIDPDSTDEAPPASGGSQTVKIQKVSPNYNARASHNSGSANTTTYSTFYVKVVAEGFSTDQYANLFLAEDNNYESVYQFFISQNSSDYLTFNLMIYNNGAWAYYEWPEGANITLDQWYRVDIKYNDSDNTWEWKIDGDSKNSGSLTGTHYTNCQHFYIGDTSYSGTLTAYFDLINIDSTGYVTFGSADVDIEDISDSLTMGESVLSIGGTVILPASDSPSLAEAILMMMECNVNMNYDQGVPPSAFWGTW